MREQLQFEDSFINSYNRMLLMGPTPFGEFTGALGGEPSFNVAFFEIYLFFFHYAQKLNSLYATMFPIIYRIQLSGIGGSRM